MTSKAFIGYPAPQEGLRGLVVEEAGYPDYVSLWFSAMDDQSAGIQHLEAMLEEEGASWYEVYLDDEGTLMGEAEEVRRAPVEVASLESLVQVEEEPFEYFYLLNEDEVSIYDANLDYLGAFFYRT